MQRGSLRTVFARDPAANKGLVGLLKPHVLLALRTWTCAQQAPYVVWESALMQQEDGFAVDRMLVVEASADLRMERIRHRNPDWPAQDIASIVALQATWPSPSLTIADTIANDGTPQMLGPAVEALHHHYLRLWS